MIRRWYMLKKTNLLHHLFPLACSQRRPVFSPVSSRSWSRRRFLLQAMAAGSAPFLLPAWSAEDAPANRIALGFIGLGVQGRGLLAGFLSRKGTRVAAVCDVDTHRREDGRDRVDGFYQVQDRARLRRWLPDVRGFSRVGRLARC